MLPEALHQVTITMSDRGIPASYRHMHGFGSHTYSLINANNERVWVKYHLTTQQGIKNLTDEEAAAIVAHDRESHQKDLFEAIELGDFPRWTFSIQIMTEERANNHYENPFDISKIWRHSEFPKMEVGVLELNRNPENYFADVEQAAFNPSNVVPGLGLSPDKLLQGRLFSYGDAQRYRLGVNHHLIPVNAPKHGYHAYHRDGQMRVDGNYGAATSYQPNSIGQWAEQPDQREPPLELKGAMDSYEPKNDMSDDCFKYPGSLYRLMAEPQKAILIDNTARNMDGVSDNVRLRHAAHCWLADPDYGTRLAAALKVDQVKVVELAKMSHDQRMKATSVA
jgi:catalase